MGNQIALSLVQNAALLLLIVYLYDLASRRWRWQTLSSFGIPVGLALGLVGLALMATPISMSENVYIDIRTVLLAASGLFFGAVSTVVAMIMTAAYRLHLGGTGAWIAVGGIFLSGAMGLAWRRFRGNRVLGFSEVWLFSVAQHVVMMLMIASIPDPRSAEIVAKVALPMMLVCPAAAGLMAVLIGNRIAYEKQADTLSQSEATLQTLYRYAPVALLKEDWSKLKAAFGEIRARGHLDLDAYLAERPSEIRRLAGLVDVIEANEAAAAMVGAHSMEEVKGPLDRFFDDKGLEAFFRQLMSMAQGRLYYQGEANFTRADGERREIIVSHFVPPGHEEAFDLVMVSVLDVTEQSRHQAEVQAGFKLLNDLASHVPGMLFQSIQLPGELPSTYTYVSEGAVDIYGVSATEIIADPSIVLRQIHPDEREGALAAIHESARTLTTFHREDRLYRADGSLIWVSVIARPQRQPDGSVLWHGYLKDVTALKRAEARLRLASRVFDTTNEAIMITDAEANIVAVNPRFTRMTGYAEAEVTGRNPHLLNSGRHDAAFFRNMWSALKEKGSWAGEIWNRRKDGEVYPEWLTVSAVSDEEGAVQNYVGVFSDLTAIHRAQLLAERLAYEDVMTGLNNRLAFLQLLEKRVEELNQGRRYGGMMLIDIDDFKQLNETRGLMFGDALLKEVASRLRQMLGLEHYLARVGPDEFGVLLVQQSGSRDEIGRQLFDLAERLRGRLGEAFHFGEDSVEPSFGIGIVVLPESSTDRAENILQQAEWALNQSRGRGGERIRFFQTDMGKEVRERYRLEQELADAATADQLRLYLQPQVDAAGRQVSAEALIRWEHPERGLVPPGMFIPLAEASDRIYELERWMLREVSRLVAQLDARGRSLKISLNISAKHFSHADFVEEVRSQIAVSGADPGCLVFEITEGIVIDDVAAATSKMLSLAEMGIHFSLDDFGTGYSSLSYLKRLPVQEIKIDRSFIKDVPDDASDAALVETILGVARTLKLRVVAEGVETQAQADFLNERGDVIHQGYLYDRPMPVAQWLEKYIDAKA